MPFLAFVKNQTLNILNWLNHTYFSLTRFSLSSMGFNLESNVTSADIEDEDLAIKRNTGGGD